MEASGCVEDAKQEAVKRVVQIQGPKKPGTVQEDHSRLQGGGRFSLAQRDDLE